MLVVTFKYDGNGDVITVVFLSLQIGSFSLLPQKLIPLPALKALQNTDAGDCSSQTLQPSDTDNH